MSLGYSQRMQNRSPFGAFIITLAVASYVAGIAGCDDNGATGSSAHSDKPDKPDGATDNGTTDQVVASGDPAKSNASAAAKQDKAMAREPSPHWKGMPDVPIEPAPRPAAEAFASAPRCQYRRRGSPPFEVHDEAFGAVAAGGLQGRVHVGGARVRLGRREQGLLRGECAVPTAAPRKRPTRAPVASQ